MFELLEFRKARWYRSRDQVGMKGPSRRRKKMSELLKMRHKNATKIGASMTSVNYQATFLRGSSRKDVFKKKLIEKKIRLRKTKRGSLLTKSASA
jgi:hypothetical protein